MGVLIVVLVNFSIRRTISDKAVTYAIPEKELARLQFAKSCQFCNLTKASISGIDLRNVDLYKANLSDANLSGANLSGANLSGANLLNAVLTGANLSGIDLSGRDLRSLDLSGVILTKAILIKKPCNGDNTFGRIRDIEIDINGGMYIITDELESSLWRISK